MEGVGRRGHDEVVDRDGHVNHKHTSTIAAGKEVVGGVGGYTDEIINSVFPGPSPRSAERSPRRSLAACRWGTSRHNVLSP